MPRALKTTAEYREHYTRLRDEQQIWANPDMSARNEVQQQQQADYMQPIHHLRRLFDAQRDSQEIAANFASALNNLKVIDKLTRLLAHKRGIELVEPGRRNK